MTRYFFRILLYIFFAGFVLSPVMAFAAMTSTNYTIYADSISVSGGGLSTSTNYALEQTVGETVAGSAAGSTYTVNAGFQSLERDDLSFSLSNSSISLGTIDSAMVSSGSTVATVGTSAISGYTLTLSAVSGSAPYNVSDGAVTAGENEYGFSVSGSNQAFSGDVAVSAGQAIAAASSPVVSDATTLTFKASKTTSASAGTYSQTLTLLLSANF